MSAPQRARGAKRPAKNRRGRAVAPRLAVVGSTATTRERRARRGRVAAALERCDARDRLVLALTLVERLTPAEAADVLGMPVNRLTRAYQAALAHLRRVMLGLPSTAPRSRASRTAAGETRLRKTV